MYERKPTLLLYFSALSTTLASLALCSQWMLYLYTQLYQTIKGFKHSNMDTTQPIRISLFHHLFIIFFIISKRVEQWQS